MRTPFLERDVNENSNESIKTFSTDSGFFRGVPPGGSFAVRPRETGGRFQKPTTNSRSEPRIPGAAGEFLIRAANSWNEGLVPGISREFLERPANSWNHRRIPGMSRRFPEFAANS
jgi:hypothetical protein